MRNMALSADRVVWQDSFDTLEPAVLTRPIASGPRVTLDTFDMRFDAKQVGPITGAAATLAYSLFTLNGSFGNITGGDLKTVAGGVATPLAGAPAAALMAATSSRIALVPAPRTSNDVVEVRDASTGAVITSFPVVGTVRHIAMWGSTVALLIKGSLGHQRIVTRDASTGAVLRSWLVSDATGGQIDVSGAGVVYHVGGTIRLLYRVNGNRGTIKVESGSIVGLSIEGRRIVWAVNAGTSGRVVTVLGVSICPTSSAAPGSFAGGECLPEPAIARQVLAAERGQLPSELSVRIVGAQRAPPRRHAECGRRWSALRSALDSSMLPSESSGYTHWTSHRLCLRPTD